LFLFFFFILFSIFFTIKLIKIFLYNKYTVYSRSLCYYIFLKKKIIKNNKVKEKDKIIFKFFFLKNFDSIEYAIEHSIKLIIK